MRSPVPNMLDVIVQPLWDTATILAAGTTQLTLFQTPIGGGTSAFGTATTAKKLADTNMRLAGQLPTGYNFVVLGFRIQPAFTLTAQDAKRWSLGATFTFQVASKPYLEVPLDTLPAGCGPYGSFTLAVAADNAIASHGYPTLGNAYTIGKKPLELSQGQNFFVQLDWVSVVAVTTTIPTQPAAGLPIRVYLDGFYKRIIQ